MKSIIKAVLGAAVVALSVSIAVVKVNAGFSGLLWSPEVRHAEGPEELVRRLQTVVMSPQMLDDFAFAAFWAAMDGFTTAMRFRSSCGWRRQTASLRCWWDAVEFSPPPPHPP